ncbi:MAG TPA: hypothetical protein VID48_05890, partial [Solirubrobacteraceae bacterium]
MSFPEENDVEAVAGMLASGHELGPTSIAVDHTPRCCEAPLIAEEGHAALPRPFCFQVSSPSPDELTAGVTFEILSPVARTVAVGNDPSGARIV